MVQLAPLALLDLRDLQVLQVLMVQQALQGLLVLPEQVWGRQELLVPLEQQVLQELPVLQGQLVL